MLRRAIRHRHDHEAYWSAFGMTPGAAQSKRAILRHVANLLHVERATARGRIHGTRFATLDEQAIWLAEQVNRRCIIAARHANLPDDATLGKLRAGEIGTS